MKEKTKRTPARRDFTALSRKQKPPARAGTSLRSAPKGPRGIGISRCSTCEDCRFLTFVEESPRPIYICEHKTDFEGRWRRVRIKGACSNFERPYLTPEEIAEIELSGGKVIRMTRGRSAIVDAADYDRLKQYRWYPVKSGRVWYAIGRIGGKVVRLHREILMAPRHLVCDHIDHDGLNNRRSNLRLCTRAQNNMNQRPRRGKKSKYKGVGWNSKRKVFCVGIRWRGKRIHIGRFTDEIAAAKAYDRKALELFGEFAYLNFPNEIRIRCESD